MSNPIYIPLMKEEWAIVSQSLFESCNRAYGKGALAASRMKLKRYRNSAALREKYTKQAEALKKIRALQKPRRIIHINQ